MKHYVMKTDGEVDVYSHIFLTWTLDTGEWSALRPDQSELESRYD
jgi:hypothetical protein